MSNSPIVEWSVLAFEQLSVGELYDLMAARQRVFVLEQDCVYCDLDGFDRVAHHIQGKSSGQLAAYARIMPPNSIYAEPSIGRVITTSEVRGQGIGKQLMQRAIDWCERQYSGEPIRIGAQQYLRRFYAQFGFVELEPYVEDGIPHVVMRRPAS